MRLTNKFIGLLVAGVTAAAVPACTTTGRAGVYYAYDEPPPPREETVVYRPGFVWVHGSWSRDYNNRWAWRNGYYVRERPGYVYESGRWERDGNRYRWHDGTWRARGGVVIRRR